MSLEEEMIVSGGIPWIRRVLGGLTVAAVLWTSVSGAAGATDGDRQEAEIQFSRGLYALNVQDYQEAWQRFNAAHASSPSEARYLLYMGIADNRLGRFDRASDSLRQAQRLMPDLPQLQYELGVADMGLGNWDSALAHMQIAREQQPRRGEVYLRLGVIQDQLRQPSEAMSSYERAEALDPSLADQAAFYRGRTYLQTGMIQEARQEFQSASGSGNPRLNKLSGDYLGRIDVAEDGPPERWEFTGWFAISYDDNVVLNPDDPSVFGISDMEDTRAVLYADVMYHPWVGRRSTFGVGLGAYQSLHQDLDEYDLFGVLPELRYTYVTDNFFMQGDAQYAEYELDNDDYLESLNLEFRPGFRQKSAGRTEFILAWSDLDYEEDERSGEEWTGGIEQFFYPWQNKKRYLTVLATFADHDAGNDYERSELTAGTAFYTPLGAAWDFYAGLSYVDFDYDNIHSFFGEARQDEEWLWILRSTYDINKWLSLVFEYRGTEHDSNIAFYDYDRQVVTVGILATP